LIGVRSSSTGNFVATSMGCRYLFADPERLHNGALNENSNGLFRKGWIAKEMDFKRS